MAKDTVAEFEDLKKKKKKYPEFINSAEVLSSKFFCFPEMVKSELTFADQRIITDAMYEAISKEYASAQASFI